MTARKLLSVSLVPYGSWEIRASQGRSQEVNSWENVGQSKSDGPLPQSATQRSYVSPVIRLMFVVGFPFVSTVPSNEPLLSTFCKHAEKSGPAPKATTQNDTRSTNTPRGCLGLVSWSIRLNMLTHLGKHSRRQPRPVTQPCCYIPANPHSTRFPCISSSCLIRVAVVVSLPYNDSSPCERDKDDLRRMPIDCYVAMY